MVGEECKDDCLGWKKKLGKLFQLAGWKIRTTTEDIAFLPLKSNVKKGKSKRVL